MKQKMVLIILLLAAALLLPPHARASELVYTPVNPSFGGSPLNGSWLLGSAGSQNKFKDNGSRGYQREEKTLLRKVAEDFSRRAVGRIENEILDSIFDGGLSSSDLGSLGTSSDEAVIYIEVNQYGDGNTSTIDLGY